jgi:hypothetical protein
VRPPPSAPRSHRPSGLYQFVELEATGQAIGLTATWTTTCPANCTPATSQPWAAGTPIAVGQKLSATLKLTATPSSTEYAYLDPEFSISIHKAGTVAVLPPAEWSGAEIRCDKKISIANTSGCVTPWYTPTLVVSRASYGSSADMIAWAQSHLSGHWGSSTRGQPLHRLQKASDQAANRNAICGTTKFTADPTIPDDSCDEFPFAGTWESAALNGVDHGNACAQVAAAQTANTGTLSTDWATVAVVGTVTGGERCVRGHIPSSLNTDLGGSYGVFVKDARLADNDPFWLTVA